MTERNDIINLETILTPKERSLLALLVHFLSGRRAGTWVSCPRALLLRGFSYSVTRSALQHTARQEATDCSVQRHAALCDHRVSELITIQRYLKKVECVITINVVLKVFQESLNLHVMISCPANNILTQH